MCGWKTSPSRAVMPMTSVFVAEELLDGVGGDDEGVALGEGFVGIDDHLKRADL
jgi:hypothetical protein